MYNLQKYRSMKKLYFEIDLGGTDVTDKYGGGAWRGADYLVAEGYTLEDLLEDQTVFVYDQDGGEVGQLEGWDYTDALIIKKFKETLDNDPWLFYADNEIDPMALAKEAIEDGKFSRD